MQQHDFAIKFIATCKYNGATRLALGTELGISIHEQNNGMFREDFMDNVSDLRLDEMAVWWPKLGTLDSPVSGGEQFILSSLEWLDSGKLVASYIHHGLM